MEEESVSTFQPSHRFVAECVVVNRLVSHAVSVESGSSLCLCEHADRRPSHWGGGGVRPVLVPLLLDSDFYFKAAVCNLKNIHN